MPRNFVILFRGREGSSAIIDLLGKHPDVCVPVFEQLDSFAAGKICKPGEIGRLAELTWATGHYEQACAALHDAQPAPGGPEQRAVGFKWRIWGDADTVVEALARSRVTVFHLFRLQLRELVTSLLFTDSVLPALHLAAPGDVPEGGHQQFRFAALPAEQRDAFRARLAGLRFKLDPAEFLAKARELIADKQSVHDTYLRPLQQRGVAVHAILYEDFLNNRPAFLRSLCAAIDVAPAPLAAAETWYRKVLPRSPALQVENWEQINAQPELRALIADYQALIMQGHRYLGVA